MKKDYFAILTATPVKKKTAAFTSLNKLGLFRPIIVAGGLSN